MCWVAYSGIRVQRFARLAAIFGLAVTCTVPLYAQTAPETIENFTLDNGLEVIVIPNHRVPAVSQMLWFKIGAADDPLGKSGLAHFHEHVMFLGTQAHKAREYSTTIFRNGGEENAFTGYDATSYYITIAKDKLPLAMELEADRLHALTATDEDVAKEKQVIIEERRMRIENNPDALLDEQMNAALFRNHPYHWPIIGWLHEMEGLTKQDVLAFHERWYHPNNAILILSGDITAAEARPLVEKYYGDLPKAEIPARIWNQEPPQNTQRHIVLHHANVKQPMLRRSYVAASMKSGNTKDVFPLFMLAQLLGEGKTSRLYKSLVVEQKLATGTDVGYNGFTFGPSQLEITLIPEQGVTLEVLEKALDKELARAMKDGFTASDMTRAKTQLKAETLYARDGLSGVARIMGWITIVGLDKNTFARWPQLIEAVTPQQVQDAAHATLIPTGSVTGYLLPEEKP